MLGQVFSSSSSSFSTKEHKKERDETRENGQHQRESIHLDQLETFEKPKLLIKFVHRSSLKNIFIVKQNTTDEQMIDEFNKSAENFEDDFSNINDRYRS